MALTAGQTSTPAPMLWALLALSATAVLAGLLLRRRLRPTPQGR
jgi:hypothetical protein